MPIPIVTTKMTFINKFLINFINDIISINLLLF